jgi:hypothetical protein
MNSYSDNAYTKFVHRSLSEQQVGSTDLDSFVRLTLALIHTQQ